MIQPANHYPRREKYTPAITFTPEQSDGYSSAWAKMESIAEKNNIESAIESAYSSWDAEFWKTQTGIPNPTETPYDTTFDAETEKAYYEYAIEGAEAKLDLVEKNDKINEEVQKSYAEAAQEFIDVMKEGVTTSGESGAARVGSVGMLAGVLVSALVAVAAL